MNLQLIFQQYLDNNYQPVIKNIILPQLPKERTAYKLVKSMMLSEVRRAIFNME